MWFDCVTYKSEFYLLAIGLVRPSFVRRASVIRLRATARSIRTPSRRPAAESAASSAFS